MVVPWLMLIGRPRVVDAAAVGRRLLARALSDAAGAVILRWQNDGAYRRAATWAFFGKWGCSTMIGSSPGKAGCGGLNVAASKTHVHKPWLRRLGPPMPKPAVSVGILTSRPAVFFLQFSWRLGYDGHSKLPDAARVILL